MTNTKHTPGPWQVGHVDTQSVRADGLLVATTACQRKEWQANTRLIAAAPELLAALEGLLSCCQSGEWADIVAAHEKALAAIKKAKGE